MNPTHDYSEQFRDLNRRVEALETAARVPQVTTSGTNGTQVAIIPFLGSGGRLTAGPSGTWLPLNKTLDLTPIPDPTPNPVARVQTSPTGRIAFIFGGALGNSSVPAIQQGMMVRAFEPGTLTPVPHTILGTESLFTETDTAHSVFPQPAGGGVVVVAPNTEVDVGVLYWRYNTTEDLLVQNAWLYVQPL